MSFTSIATWIVIAAAILVLMVVAVLWRVRRRRAPCPPPEAVRGVVDVAPEEYFVGAPPAPAPPTEIRIEWQAGGADLEPVRFHTLWPRSVHVEEWNTLFVYMYSGRRGLEGARADFELRRPASHDRYEDSAAGATVQPGAQITIVPEAQALMFNPPLARILWLEEWHRVEFRMRVLAQAPLRRTGLQGRVAFFVGPLLIAETALAVDLAGDRPAARVPAPPSLGSLAAPEDFLTETSSSAYRAIFVSYSHDDAVIVDQLARAYHAIGDRYLRDVEILRSGENWNPALLQAIPRADVFQLCWSQAAKQSRYVEQEWRYALGLNRPNFIRPMYWGKPLPDPPPDLGHLHFTFVDMSV